MGGRKPTVGIPPKWGSVEAISSALWKYQLHQAVSLAVSLPTQYSWRRELEAMPQTNFSDYVDRPCVFLSSWTISYPIVIINSYLTLRVNVWVGLFSSLLSPSHIPGLFFFHTMSFILHKVFWDFFFLAWQFNKKSPCIAASFFKKKKERHWCWNGHWNNDLI